MNKYLTSIAIILTLLTSCQKEISSDSGQIVNPPPPPSYTGDSTLLDYFVKVQNNDTIYRLRFTYDSLKRISTLIRYDSSQNFTPPWMYDKYYYNGNARFPYKVIGVEYYSPNNSNTTIQHDTTYLLYDAANRVTYDSTVSDNTILSPVVFKTQRNGAVVDIDGFWGDQFSIVTTGRNLTYSNYNDTITSHPSFPYTFTYDTKPNPLYRPELEGAPILGLRIFYFRDHLIELVQKNNCTSVTRPLYSGMPNSPLYTENIAFTYRNDGYPLSANVIGVTSTQYLFKYKP